MYCTFILAHERQLMCKARQSSGIRLSLVDREILRYLFRHRGWATTNQIAEGSRVSWKTAYNHLKYLNKNRVVVMGTLRKSKYWRVNK
jgi:Fe2+ or Zn2+ uptake regulation protein